MTKMKTTPFSPDLVVNLGVVIVTPEIRRARVDFIQGRKGLYRAIVKTKAGLTVVDDLGIKNGWKKAQWQDALDVFSNFKKGALQTIEFQAEGSTHWLTVFSRSGNKINIIDSDMLANMTVGHINQDWSNSTLYNQYQYKAVGSTTWASYAFRQNN
jgi:hypothetical protein